MRFNQRKAKSNTRKIKSTDSFLNYTILKYGLLSVTIFVIIWFAKLNVESYLRHNSKFNLENIHINASSRFSKSDLIHLAGIEFGQNIFNYDIYQVKNNLEKNLFIKNADISRIMPSTIEIKITERFPLAGVMGAKNWFWMDHDGVILEPIRDVDLMDSRLIEFEKMPANIQTGEQLEPDWILPVIDAIEIFHDSVLKKKITIERFVVNENKDVIMWTDNRIEIVLGKEDMENRMARLLAILEDLKIKNQQAKKIDLRFASVPVKT